jgi:hypothetical protein
VYNNPNGYPYDNQGYFTQKQRYNSWYDWEVARANTHIINWNGQEYDHWKTMHEDVIWFDTIPCTVGPHIGDANNVIINPVSTETASRASWFKAVDGGPATTNYGTNNQVALPPSSIRYDAWDTDINVVGSTKWSDEDLYRDLLKERIELAEDCDVDCLAKGSQLTIIAILMSVAYSVVGLNAIAMFIGTWRCGWRICSVYCTFFACIFQFAILISVGAMMFSKYGALCARSMNSTAAPFLWTMADDFYVTFIVWIFSFIWMFVFVCCGMCSAFRPELNTTIT